MTVGKMQSRDRSAKYSCPLCGSLETEFYHEDRKREFYLCENCKLIFVPEKYFLSQKDEKARYDLHRNTPGNKGYVNFLSRLLFFMGKVVPKGSKGLDFGSGPEPVLARMFSEAGYPVSTYDLYYSSDTSVFKEKYDFITIAEVIEHLGKPEKEMKMLWNCLNKGGWLGIMTKFYPLAKVEFAYWSYKNDLTHVCFFSERSMNWLASELNAELNFADLDIILLNKRDGS
ncbi:MAG: class I SAM-dependent methyltransferase [Acidobacteriota bacterium]